MTLISMSPQMPSQPNYWIGLNKPTKPVTKQIFCLPFAGGNANFFRQWASSLPDDIALFALQLPGRGQFMAHTRFTSMSALVEVVYKQLQALINGPYFMVGHSMGAAIGYEICWKFVEHQQRLPETFFASGCLPVRIKRQAPWVHLMSSMGIVQELKILGGTSDEILNNSDLLSLAMPTIRADFTLIEKYHCTREQRLPVSACVWAGIDDVRIPLEKMNAWDSVFVTRPEHRVFNGGHMFIDEQQSGRECFQHLLQHILQSSQDVA